ncbi:ATP-binding protein [Pseudonocardia humida]|uniref:ATP-binding protein n=1 Tax=Pseudonocardia humida TaxID=2800819 RepID=A0ABT0ZV71_9PSEU|nr:ATP-binding protein [Pseudonocardia humida]MCO1654613.1 ATP-binding protein [Pseudonocardia humida]
MLISAVVAGLEVDPDRAEVHLAGELRLGTAPDVRRVLAKLLASHRRLLVDLSGFRLAWEPAAGVFSTALATAGGWPAAHLVLYAAEPRMATELHRRRITRTVPLVADRAAARQRLLTRPDTVSRHLHLPPEPTSPRAAREFTTAACHDWAVDDIAGGARLVVTELVTNAVEHAGTPCEVGLRLDEQGLWIEVRDHLPGPSPRPRPRAVGVGRGRGLHAVATIALRLGGTTHDDGKTVWALLSTAG